MNEILNDNGVTIHSPLSSYEGLNGNAKGFVNSIRPVSG